MPNQVRLFAKVQLVITSPPYLNSFDYTDVYMPELWALGFVKSYDDVRNLRSATLRSHVQVKWKADLGLLDDTLKHLISEITDGSKKFWNDTIPNMIGGYFIDMKNVFLELRRIMKPKGRLCVVVGTSSYYKITVPTDLLLTEIALQLGFKCDEIRIVREFTRSTQQALNQSKTLPPLRESIIVLTAT